MLTFKLSKDLRGGVAIELTALIPGEFREATIEVDDGDEFVEGLGNKLLDLVMTGNKESDTIERECEQPYRSTQKPKVGIWHGP